MDNVCKADVPASVTFLLGALQLKAPQSGRWHELSDNDWHALLSFCNWANLLLCLAQLPQDGFPPWVTKRLAEHLRDNSLRFERIKDTYREVALALHSAAIEHVVIKGFAQYPGYVADPRLRRQGDIDIYCPTDAIHRATRELAPLGYAPETTQFYGRADHLPSLNRNTGWVWRGNSFDPDMPLSLELHFCLWNKGTAYFDVKGVNEFWARRVTRQTDDLTFTGLAEPDNLGYTALHVLRNLLRGDSIIHHVYELASFLHTRAGDEEFWQSWVKLHDDSLRSLEAIAFSLAVSWFDCNIPPQVQAEFIRLPTPIRNWLAYFRWSPLETMFTPNKDRVWLHMNFIDSRREKLAVLWKVMIPRRIPGVQEPVVYVAKGEFKKSRVTQKHARYLLFLLSRATVHLKMMISTLWHGLRWWCSQKINASAHSA